MWAFGGASLKQSRLQLTEIADKRGWSQAKNATARETSFWDANHRTLQASRIEFRGSIGRNVSGWCLNSPCRGLYPRSERPASSTTEGETRRREIAITTVRGGNESFWVVSGIDVAHADKHLLLIRTKDTISKSAQLDGHYPVIGSAIRVLIPSLNQNIPSRWEVYPRFLKRRRIKDEIAIPIATATKLTKTLVFLVDRYQNFMGCFSCGFGPKHCGRLRLYPQFGV